MELWQIDIEFKIDSPCLGSPDYAAVTPYKLPELNTPLRSPAPPATPDAPTVPNSPIQSLTPDVTTSAAGHLLTKSTVKKDVSGYLSVIFFY